ncbi:MAG: hypothetical protein NZ992_00400 [Candidatus Korarchaeum sp.]|nr:hypothetical protein [Candidatus Korarchaeum sp.]MDW8035047.1 hypothetical protein [Candidatus Korarchaeum sp.]
MEVERLAHVLILVGVTISILTFLMIPMLAILSSSPSVSGGGCVIILFLPICFGFGEQPLLMAIIAMLMSLIIIAVSYLLLRTFRDVPQHQ